MFFKKPPIRLFISFLTLIAITAITVNANWVTDLTSSVYASLFTTANTADLVVPAPQPMFFATLYNWNATAGGVWTNSANWTPTRTTPAADDILQFPSGTYTVTGVPTETIGQLFASGGGTNVTLQPAAGLVTLTISGGAGNDLIVQPSNTFNISGGTTNTNTLKVFLASGTTASIGGNITFSGAQHQIDAGDASGLTFASGSSFTYNPGSSSGAAFTNAGTANAVVFNSGATYVFQGGADPFQLTTPSSKVVFNTGSLFLQTGTGTPSFSGRVYSNYELNNAAAITVSGGTAMSIDNITVTQGTLNYNMTGTTGHSIKGNISVAPGATLNFSPATAGTVNLNGTSAQSISGSGTISTSSLSTLAVGNTAAAVTFNTNFNVNGTLTVGAGGVLTPGSPTVQVNSAGNAGTITGTGKVQVTSLAGNPFSTQYRFSTFNVSALTVEWAGAGAQGIENGVSGYGGIITSGSGAKTIGGSGTLAINGSVTIGSGTTLDQGANNLNVSGNWTNNGSFTSGTSSVTFNGLTGQTIAGNTSFYTFVKSITTPAQTMNFTAGSTTTATNSLTFSGTSGNLLSLRSTSTGTQWNLVAPASTTASFVDVKDSNNTGTAISPTNSVNSGNNIGWNFVVAEPVMTTSPASLPFGNQPVGATSGALNFTINNTGTATLNYSLAITGTDAAQFAITGTGSTVTAGGNVQRGITFTPTSIGAKSAILTVSGDDPANPSDVITLSGTGIAPPVITSTAPTTATEDTLYTYNATSSDPDGPGATWSVRGTDTCGGSIVPATGVYTFTPAGPTPPGSCVVAIRVSDGGTPNLTGDQSTTVTITAVNDAPIAVDDVRTTTQDVALVVTGASLVSNDIDPDGPGLSVTSVSSAVNGSVGLSAGTITFTPTSGFIGSASFDYTVSDGSLSDTGVVNITVSAADVTAPVITYTPIPNGSLNPTLSVTATDAVGVTGVTIFWSINGGGVTSAGCTLSGGTAQNGTWSCQITGMTSPASVAYYVTAQDAAANTRTNPVGGAVTPNLFTLGAATVPGGSYENASLGGGVTLGGNVTITAGLTLNGIVTTGANKITLACGVPVTGAGVGSYVIGNFERAFCSVETFIFPVGTLSDGSLVEVPNGVPVVDEYTPLTAQITGGTAGSSLTVSVTDGFLPGSDEADSASRYWSITENGNLTADLSFAYLNQDISGDENTYRILRRSGSTIAVYLNGTVNPATNSVNANAVTDFSGWAAGNLSPTAANVSLGGRILTADGLGVTNAIVVVSGNSLATPIRAVTGPFGYYQFDGLAVGETYVVTVNSKRFAFTVPNRVVSLTDNALDIDFVANPLE